jgi:hypothetical protein
MANLLVERSYTYIGRDTPTLFYYHQACWEKAAPDALKKLEEERRYEVARGTVRLVNWMDIPSLARCQQCEQKLEPREVSARAHLHETL